MTAVTSLADSFCANRSIEYLNTVLLVLIRVANP